MNKLARGGAVAAAFLAVTGATYGPYAYGQGAKKPAAKAGTKAAQKPAAPAVKGTAQLAGDNGQPGQAYTLGGGNDAINFTLNSAEFTTHRVSIGDAVHAPNADEKLLVVRFTVQNPNKQETSFGWNTLKYTVVDSKNVNREFPQQVGKAVTNESLDIALKPAQKVDAFTVFKLPSDVSAPKLMVQPGGSEGRVLRYDLRDRVKPLAAPFADPADKTGATALKQIAAASGAFYPMKQLDVKFVSGAFVNGALGDHEPDEGNRFFVATLVLKNATPTAQSYGWNIIEPRWVAADGEKAEYNQAMLKGARNDDAQGELAPGEEVTVRVFTQVPKETGMKTLAVSEDGSREYVFDLSGVK